MKKIIIFSLFLLTIFIGALSQSTQRIDVGQFDRLRVVDGINVECICGTDKAGTVEIPNVDTGAYLLIENNKGTLKMQLQTDGLTVQGIPAVKVYAQALTRIENSGDSTVTVANPGTAELLKLRVIGNGKLRVTGIRANAVEAKIDTGRGCIQLQGNASNAKLRTIGSGNILATELPLKTASIFIGGTGCVYCRVADELNVTGLGSGKVYCTGNPTIKNRTLGSVKVVNE